MLRRVSLVVLAFALAACGIGPEKVATIKVGLTTKGNQDCVTEGAGTVDLSSNKDFMKFKDQIEEAELVAVRVVITNQNTDGENKASTASGEIQFTNPEGNSVKLGAYDVKIATGESKAVTLDTAAAKTLVNMILKAPYTVTVNANGSADAFPCRFAFNLEFDFRIQAKLSALF